MTRPGGAVSLLLTFALCVPLAAAAPEMTVTTFAGGPQPGARDGFGTEARFHSPQDFAVGRDGAIYVADTGNSTVRKVFPDGRVTTLAGLAGRPGFADGVGGRARFRSPSGLAVDPNGFVFVSDTGNHCVRRISPAGEVITWAGDPEKAGDSGGASDETLLGEPGKLAIAPDGSILVADVETYRLRRIAPDRTVTTLLSPESPYDTEPISSLAAFSDGSLFFARYAIVYRLDADGSEEVASGGIPCTYPVCGNYFGEIRGIARDEDGFLLVATDRSVFRFSRGLYYPDLLHGSTGDRGLVDGHDARFRDLGALHRLADGTLLVLERGGAIRRIAPDGLVTTLAGAATEPVRRDGDRLTARFEAARAIAAAPDGGFVVVDGDAIRSVDSDGNVRTLVTGAGWVWSVAATREGIYATQGRGISRVVGNRLERWAGDPDGSGNVDGELAAARFGCPNSIVAAPSGDLFVLDPCGDAIRRISRGFVSTTARNYWLGWWSASTLALFPDGSLAVAIGNWILRARPNGTVVWLTGGGGSGDVDGPADFVDFSYLVGAAADRFGHLFVVDGEERTVRRLGSDRFVATVAGGRRLRKPDGEPEPLSRGGIGGTGGSAWFEAPWGCAADDAGRLYVADGTAIRRLEYAPSDRLTADSPCDPEGSTLTAGSGGEEISWALTRIPAPSRAAIEPEAPGRARFVPDLHDVFEVEATASTGAGTSVRRRLFGAEEPARIRIEAPPTICVFGSASLTASIEGGIDGTFRWYRNGQPIPEVTWTSFEAKSIEPDDVFTASVDSDCGTVFSDPVSFDVETEPPFVEPVEPIAEVPLGSPFSITAHASGGIVSVPSARWLHAESSRITIGATLSFDAVTPEVAGRWVCEVKNPCGTVYAAFFLRIR